MVDPPPVSLAVNRMWKSNAEGYIYAVGYFTRAQEQDPLWEAARLGKSETAVFCDHPELVRRDVQWLPASPDTGEECAKIVYSFACPLRKAEWGSDLATDREAELRARPEKPIGAKCGEKDYTRLPKP
jgi:hypothetical protein